MDLALEPQLPPQEPENNDIDLRNVIIEDEEEEAESSDVKAAGRPSNYSFNDFCFGNRVKTFNPAQAQEQCGSVTSVKTK